VIGSRTDLQETFMHQSRLCTFVLDCQVDDLAASTEFWSKALGKPVGEADPEGDGKYASLRTEKDEPILLLQRVDHESRIHLDIETDDIDAEVERLEKLGAKKLEKVKRWVVMQAPSGHRFCVIRKQREAFGPHLNRWDP
jgi:predicted enzyme related to lactoylglutathione lyase